MIIPVNRFSKTAAVSNGTNTAKLHAMAINSVLVS